MQRVADKTISLIRFSQHSLDTMHEKQLFDTFLTNTMTRRAQNLLLTLAINDVNQLVDHILMHKRVRIRVIHHGVDRKIPGRKAIFGVKLTSCFQHCVAHGKIR